MKRRREMLATANRVKNSAWQKWFKGESVHLRMPASLANEHVKLVMELFGEASSNSEKRACIAELSLIGELANFSDLVAEAKWQIFESMEEEVVR